MITLAKNGLTENTREEKRIEEKMGSQKVKRMESNISKAKKITNNDPSSRKRSQ